MPTRSPSQSLLSTEHREPDRRAVATRRWPTLRRRYMQDGRKPTRIAPQWERSAAPFVDVEMQLAENFAAERVTFDIPLTMNGTQFERPRSRRHSRDTLRRDGQLRRDSQARDQLSAARAVGLATDESPLPCVPAIA